MTSPLDYARPSQEKPPLQPSFWLAVTFAVVTLPPMPAIAYIAMLLAGVQIQFPDFLSERLHIPLVVGGPALLAALICLAVFLTASRRSRERRFAKYLVCVACASAILNPLIFWLILKQLVVG
jgi:cytochrome b subunit of formate dehydrogenase